MARRAEPKKDIEYTFRFRNGNCTHRTVLIYEGMNEKGRCVFYNKLSNAYTSMTPKRFGYIHRFNLVSEKPIIKELTPTERARQKARQERLKLEAQQREEQNKIKVYIGQLRSLNKVKKIEVERIAKRSVEDIIKDLESLSWNSRTAPEWYSISHIIDDNDIGQGEICAI